jgi:hypothetical protein
MSRARAKTLVLAKRGLAMAGCGYGTGDHAALGGLIGGIGAVSGGDVRSRADNTH